MDDETRYIESLQPGWRGERDAAHIEKLLDAAFHELQHDTGPNNEEYVWQRKNLKEAFNRVLRGR